MSLATNVNDDTFRDLTPSISLSMLVNLYYAVIMRCRNLVIYAVNTSRLSLIQYTRLNIKLGVI